MEQRITTLHFVPSMLRIFLESEGVEQLPQPAAGDLQRRGAAAAICSSASSSGSDAELHNLYGPTEAAVDVTYWACRPTARLTIVPIGQPIWNTQLYILDRVPAAGAGGSAGRTAHRRRAVWRAAT